MLQEANTMTLPPWLAAVVHPFFASMLHLDTDARVARANQEYDRIKSKLIDHVSNGSTGQQAASGASALADAADAALARIRGTPFVQQLPSVQVSSSADTVGHGDSRPSQESAAAVGGLLAEVQASLKRLEGRASGCAPAISLPLEHCQPEHWQQQSAEQATSRGGLPASNPQHAAQHEGMVLLAVLLCTLLRGCRLQEHKARVVWLLRDAAVHCDDETRLQRVLPYLVAATSEPLSAVKAVALRAVALVLAQVHCRATWLAAHAEALNIAQLSAWAVHAGSGSPTQRGQGVQRVCTALPVAAAF